MPKSLPLVVSILGAFWGGVSMMSGRHLPWSGLTFIASIVLFIMGLNFYFYGSFV